INRIPTLRLDARVRASIKKTLENKRGVSIVYVRMAGRGKGHACLLVFDASTRKQHFFNPWGYRGHWMQKAMWTRGPFVEGFDVAHIKEDCWVHKEQSLQAKFDQTGVPGDEGGNCGVFTILVAILCLRFGVGDPKFMATLFITENFRGRSVVGEITTRLWTWILSMEKAVRVLQNPLSAPATKKSAREELAIKLFLPHSSALCGVYCPGSDKVCERKACARDVFCWQHRYLLRNKDKRGKNKKKCTARQAECRR
ncbi:unnamed protein product, partial [Ectocarpus sp. 12 AP-2014]